MKSLNTYILSIVAAFALMMASSNSAFAQPQEQCTICHATGSNTYNELHVSCNAINGHFENNGTQKAGHEEDIRYYGNQSCPTPPLVPEFGLITGGLAALTSTGVFLFLKKRNS